MFGWQSARAWGTSTPAKKAAGATTSSGHVRHGLRGAVADTCPRFHAAWRRPRRHGGLREKGMQARRCPAAAGRVLGGARRRQGTMRSAAARVSGSHGGSAYRARRSVAAAQVALREATASSPLRSGPARPASPAPRGDRVGRTRKGYVCRAHGGTCSKRRLSARLLYQGTPGPRPWAGSVSLDKGERVWGRRPPGATVRVPSPGRAKGGGPPLAAAGRARRPPPGPRAR